MDIPNINIGVVYSPPKKKKPKEVVIETYLREQVEAHGGLCMKFTSPTHSGVPDRVIILNNHTCFVETKRPGGNPRELQKSTIQSMIDCGADVRVIDTKSKVDAFIKELT